VPDWGRPIERDLRNNQPVLKMTYPADVALHATIETRLADWTATRWVFIACTTSQALLIKWTGMRQRTWTSSWKTTNNLNGAIGRPMFAFRATILADELQGLPVHRILVEVSY